MTNQYASINPKDYSQDTPETFDPTSFAALVEVVKSRYTESQPFGDTAPKVQIEWTLRSTKDNIFTKRWSTGLKWEEPNLPIDDGKRLAVPIRALSDGMYMIQKAISAGFPENLITNDISVFEGHTFLIADGKNPRIAASGKKAYPKKYHPEGWETAKSAALAKRAAKESGATESGAADATSTKAVLTNSYVPPALVQTNVKQAATEALVAILAASGGKKVDRTAILQGLNKYEGSKAWSPNLRTEVTMALYDYKQLSSIVTDNPVLTLTGNASEFAVSFNGK